ncbi:hypothetical protein Tco_0500773 [Tanacetum coccineum]
MIKQRLQHSSRTIHDGFHEVLHGMMEFAKEVVRPTSAEPNSNMSDRHRALREIFLGAIGALDGTLVHVVVPINEQIAYRGRGGRRIRSVGFVECKSGKNFTEIESIFNNEEEYEGHVEEEADAIQWGAQSTHYKANLRDEIANGL